MIEIKSFDKVKPILEGINEKCSFLFVAKLTTGMVEIRFPQQRATFLLMADGHFCYSLTTSMCFPVRNLTEVEAVQFITSYLAPFEKV